MSFRNVCVMTKISICNTTYNTTQATKRNRTNMECSMIIQALANINVGHTKKHMFSFMLVIWFFINNNLPTLTKLFYVVDVNECESKPCENGGTCTDAGNRYTCKCTPGFTGANCETGINQYRRVTLG